jgi:hypothetical protein
MEVELRVKRIDWHAGTLRIEFDGVSLNPPDMLSRFARAGQ